MLAYWDGYSKGDKIKSVFAFETKLANLLLSLGFKYTNNTDTSISEFIVPNNELDLAVKLLISENNAP